MVDTSLSLSLSLSLSRFLSGDSYISGFPASANLERAAEVRGQRTFCALGLRSDENSGTDDR